MSGNSLGRIVGNSCKYLVVRDSPNYALVGRSLTINAPNTQGPCYAFMLSLFVRVLSCRRFCDGRASKVHQILLAFNRATPTNTSQMTSITQFHHISPRTRIWFGTRGSEVQILSPRPINSNYLRRCQTRQDRPTWFWPRCFQPSEQHKYCT